MKRQPLEWKEIFANKATDKGLISKTQAAHAAQLKKKKKKKTKKMAEDLNSISSKKTWVSST